MPFNQEHLAHAPALSLAKPGRYIHRPLHVPTLTRLARIVDMSHVLAPSEIFDACCEVVAPALGMITSVIIDTLDGATRSMSWRADGIAWSRVQGAEGHAWASFATLLDPVPTSRGSNDQGIACQHVTQLRLPVPLLGILECETSGPIARRDKALLDAMAAALSVALHRRHMVR